MITVKVAMGGPRPPYYQRHATEPVELTMYRSVTIEVRVEWSKWLRIDLEWFGWNADVFFLLE